MGDSFGDGKGLLVGVDVKKDDEGVGDSFGVGEGLLVGVGVDVCDGSAVGYGLGYGIASGKSTTSSDA